MIADVENAMIAALAAAAPVRVVDSVPAGFDLKEAERRLRLAPALYVAFEGGRLRAETDAILDADFQVFVLTHSASGEKARRLAAYQLVEQVIAALHNLALPGLGTLAAHDVKNLYAASLDDQGLSLYSVRFALALSVPATLSLADWITLTATWNETVTDTLTLPPQGS
ncbi:MAG TPA: phage protein Gp37 [Stellaceae bacterium]|nr:phage protein Gp37 [Stellaceae bacterium]